MRKLLFLSAFLLGTAAISFGNMITISNDTIRIGVDDASSRFWMETIEGEPGNNKDNNAQLLYKKLPLTSFTTLNINGENVIFGSDNGNYLKRAYIEGKKIVCGWEYNGVMAVQELSIVNGSSTGFPDTMLVTYKLVNKSGRKIKAGIRVLMDVMTGNVKPKGFGVPGQGTISRETLFFRDNIPPFWFIYDNYDNPVIHAQGTLTAPGNTKPDRLIFAAWDRFYDNPWDFSVDSSKELRRLATPEYDSAVAVFYDPIDLEKEQTLMVSTSYGLYGTSIFTEKDMMLSLTVPNDPGHPPVPVSAQFVNQGNLMLDRLQMEIIVPRGFKLASNETNIVSFVKVATNEEYSAIWNLVSGSIGGNFKIKVRATGWNEDRSNSIESEQNFYMNYVENPVATNVVKTNKPAVVVTPVTTVKPVAVTMTNTVQVTNQMVVVDEVMTNASPEELQLMQEIRQLDDIIGEINKKYQVLMGIYKNVYKPDQKYLEETEADLKKYQDILENQESILSNEKQLLKED